MHALTHMYTDEHVHTHAPRDKVALHRAFELLYVGTGSVETCKDIHTPGSSC